MKTRKIILITVGTLLLLVVAAVTGGTFFMLNYSLNAEGNRGRDEKAMYASLYEWNPQIKGWVDSLNKVHALRDTFIMARDGDRHHAVYIRNATNDNRVAILVHGYVDSYVSMLSIAQIYSEMGYHVLLPELHGHGRSEGNNIQMGWNDRKDVEEWMDIANHLFADSTGTTRMLIHGVSMGAATTMCISGDSTANYVKCFVEDCGYTSVWDEFKYQLSDQFGLPEFPLMYTTSWLCKMKYGWSFDEASPLSQVRKCTKPMLFIHGSKDLYVPTKMVYTLFAAKKGDKELWIAKGTPHAGTICDYPQEYRKRLKAFTAKYMKAGK